MARKKNTKGAQIENHLQDASIASPPYEVAFGTTNTEIEKSKKIELHSCKCDKIDRRKKILGRERGWESITNLYKDTDTTLVWDDVLQKPTIISKTKKVQEDPYLFDENYQINDFQEDISYPQKNVKPKPVKLSLLSLYRRHKSNKHRKDQYPKNLQMEENIVPVPDNETKNQLIFFKNPKKKVVIDRYATGDDCKKGQCREEFEQLYKLHGLKYGKNAISKNKEYNEKEQKRKVIRKNVSKKTEEKSQIKDDSGKKENRKEENKKQKANNVSNIVKGEKENKEKKQEKKKETETKKGHVKKEDSKPGNIKKDTKYSKIVSKVNNVKGNTKTSLMKMVKKTSKNLNIGQGDQKAALKNRDLKNFKHKVSFIDKVLRPACKCKSDNGHAPQTVLKAGDQTGEPFFEMKVDSLKMQVINTPEVKGTLRKYGKTEREQSCICPSRLQAGKEKVCRKGICEKSLKNRYTSFNCKCVEDNEVIECKDSTCNLQEKIPKQNRREKLPKPIPLAVDTKNNKPLFQVLLDAKNMNILNSDEIKNIIKSESTNDVCSSGVCRRALEDKNVELNCRSVGNKLKADVYECEEKTCHTPRRRKCSLSYYCSRVFSKSENWDRQERRRKRHPTRRTYYTSNIRKDDAIGKSDKHQEKNDMTFKIHRDPHRHKKEKEKEKDDKEDNEDENICQCLCECHDKKFSTSAVKKQKKPRKRRRRKRKMFLKRKKIDDRTCSEILLDCIERGRDNCEKKIKKKVKKYYKEEQIAKLKNKRIDAAQRAAARTQGHNWNSIVKFLTGVLNVTFDSTRKVVKTPFRLIGDPVGSYVYVREKIKDPPALILRFLRWFPRSWHNQSSFIARRLEESNAVNVIADQIEDSAVYNAVFGKKGQSAEAKAFYERRRRIRSRRIRKRQNEALYGCRHILLTTLRKVPCLWFYHVCPDIYPQCLSLVAFMKNFLHIIIYLLAVLAWTPCILTFEMCRACLCCFFCTH